MGLSETELGLGSKKNFSRDWSRCTWAFMGLSETELGLRSKKKFSAETGWVVHGPSWVSQRLNWDLSLNFFSAKTGRERIWSRKKIPTCIETGVKKFSFNPTCIETGVKKILSTQPVLRLGSCNFLCQVLYIDFGWDKILFWDWAWIDFLGKKIFMDWGEIDFFPKFRSRSMCTGIESDDFCQKKSNFHVFSCLVLTNPCPIHVDLYWVDHQIEPVLDWLLNL